MRYYDDLPTSGSDSGRAFRDLEWEAWPVALKPNDLLRSRGNLILEDHTDYTLQDKVLKICQDLGVGAQFGGKYFAHDVWSQESARRQDRKVPIRCKTGNL